MRDFRDAKVMAHGLRDALKAKAVETTHSESLELIAKAFGYETGTFCPPRSKPLNRAQAINARFRSRHNTIRRHRRPSTARSAARASTNWLSSWLAATSVDLRRVRRHLHQRFRARR
jgi:hypothetical protein